MNIENIVIVLCILVLFYLCSNKKENFELVQPMEPLDLTNLHSLCPRSLQRATSRRGAYYSNYPKCRDGEALGTGKCTTGGTTVNLGIVPPELVPPENYPQNNYRCTNPGNPFTTLERCPENAEFLDANRKNQCFCKPTFKISDDKKSCNCPANSDIVNGQCVCKSGFQISDDKTSCDCPANSSVVDGKCGCNVFYQLNNGQCEFRPFTIASELDLQSLTTIIDDMRRGVIQ